MIGWIVGAVVGVGIVTGGIVLFVETMVLTNRAR